MQSGAKSAAPILLLLLLCTPLRESLAFFGKLLEQWCWLPVLLAVAITELTDLIVDILQANVIGIVHWPTLRCRERVAKHINHVDIARALGDTFFQNQRTFIDERI